MSAVPTITGKTFFIPLIGHPVLQVKSPVPINAKFAERGIDAVLVPIDIEPMRVAEFIESLRSSENCAGLSVTMPHKQSAFRAVDQASERARRAGAVNIIRRTKEGLLVGDMVDGIAMVLALKKTGIDVRGKNILVVGAGGAGAAIVNAVAEEQARSVVIIERDPAKAKQLIAQVAADYAGIALFDHLPECLKIDIAINASPAGMMEGDPFPYPLDLLPNVEVVADVVTKPAVSDWLKDAEARGIRIQPGADMTLAQLEMQISFWEIS